jgi:hypothetical protein
MKGENTVENAIKGLVDAGQLAGAVALAWRNGEVVRTAAVGRGWWQADPNDRSVLIFLSHNMIELSQMARGIGLGVWSAIASFHAIATS